MEKDRNGTDFLVSGHENESSHSLVVMPPEQDERINAEDIVILNENGTIQDAGKPPAEFTERHHDTQTAEKSLREHRCQVCGKSFKQRGHLTVHMRTHTGNSFPLNCSFPLFFLFMN